MQIKLFLLVVYSQNYQVRLYKTSRHAITRQTQVQESTFNYSISFAIDSNSLLITVSNSNFLFQLCIHLNTFNRCLHQQIYLVILLFCPMYNLYIYAQKFRKLSPVSKYLVGTLSNSYQYTFSLNFYDNSLHLSI